MISRREFLQAAAATVGARIGRLDARVRATARHPGPASAPRSAGRQRDAGPSRRPARPAQAGAVSRVVRQHRRRRGARPASARHRASVPRRVQDRARLVARLRLHRRGFFRAGADLRPDGGTGPHRDRTQAYPRRASRSHACPGRRRHLAGQLHVAREQGPGHGRLHVAAQARRHDRPLGVHLRRRARQGADREARLSLPRAERPRHRMERGCVQGGGHLRARRRQDRRHRPGVPLHADRQSALDDPQLVVRHPRGGSAKERRQGACRWRAACRAALPQRLRRRQEARVPRPRHRRDPDQPTPTTPCRRRSKSARPS